MKYSSSNKPLVCMQTQSTCYKGTRKMTPKGVLWHSTGANNPSLKRYVQPSDTKPAEDTYTKDKWLQILGKNQYGNDWNHIERQAGLNCWIGKLADGTITTVQTMPWDYRPWGCGSGSKGSCNSGWMQFEICEDALTDKAYFEAAYKEACEITAYYCKMYNIDPKGTVTHEGVKVPTILCHYDSYKLGLGSNHGDVDHWFKKYGKTMDSVRNDVAKLLADDACDTKQETVAAVKTYKVITNLPTYSTASDAASKKNVKGSYAPGTYYIYNKYPDGVNGVFNISKDATGNSAGSWINPAENVEKLQESAPEVTVQPVPDKKEEPSTNTPKAVYDLDYPQKHPIIEPGLSTTIDTKRCTKAIVAILKNNANFSVNIAKAFFTLAPKYRIDPMRAISQSILETGWFKFAGSSVKPEQNNFCGLGATGGGVAGNTFATIEDGVRAQLQHLYAYGCKDALPAGEDTVVDPRFKYVTRGLAPYWEQLAGRWACPGYDGNDPEAAMKAGNTYGQKIDNIFERLSNTNVTESDISKYFTNAVPEQEQQKPDDTEQLTPINPVEPEQDTDTTDEVRPDIVNIIINVLTKLVKALINLFKKNSD